MNCPKCNSKARVRCGFVNSVQRYKCKECNCQYTRSSARGRPLAQKLLAVTLYMHGMSLNAIAKLMGVQHQEFWIGCDALPKNITKSLSRNATV